MGAIHLERKNTKQKGRDNVTIDKTIIAVFAAVFAAATVPVSAGTPQAPQTMREAMQPYVDNGLLPGAISVMYDNGRETVECFGYSDVEAKRPITLDDPFMQCSQTKGFCGVTVAKLVEEGLLNIDDPVSKYLPEFETLWVLKSETNDTRTLVKAQHSLTVRMCMNHTGGFTFELPNFEAMGGWSRKMPLRSVAATAAACPLLFEPGTAVQYSNTGIDIGAAVVEAVTGKKWEDYLKATVFDPLGMKDSTFWPTDEQLSRQIEMYHCTRGLPTVPKSCDSRMQRPYNGPGVFPSAGAGLWTTARDQLKFYKMLMNLGVGENGVRILKEETVRNLLAVSSRTRGGGYSMGFKAPYKDVDDAWFGHGGAWGSNCMVNWHRKQLWLFVVQLTGRGNARPWENGRKAAQRAYFRTSDDRFKVDDYTGRTN